MSQLTYLLPGLQWYTKAECLSDMHKIMIVNQYRTIYMYCFLEKLIYFKVKLSQIHIATSVTMITYTTSAVSVVLVVVP